MVFLDSCIYTDYEAKILANYNASIYHTTFCTSLEWTVLSQVAVRALTSVYSLPYL